jgi:hypothetical protein
MTAGREIYWEQAMQRPSYRSGKRLIVPADVTIQGPAYVDGCWANTQQQDIFPLKSNKYNPDYI